MWFSSRLYYLFGKGPGQLIIRCLKNKKRENEIYIYVCIQIYMYNVYLIYIHIYIYIYDDDCFYYHSWRNNVVIAFGTLSSFLT